MKINKITRTIALILLLSLLPISLFGCKDKKEDDVVAKKKVYYDYFDTVCTISDYTGGSEDDFRQVYKHFENRLDFYHQRFDIYHEYEGVNNIATINKNAGIQPVKVDREVIDFLEFAVEMYNLTDGNVNIAMGSVLSIWHQYRTYGVEIPPMDKLTEAAKHTDITKMIVDKENSTVYLSDPEMSLDVGAIAKGYTAEVIADSLTEYGITSYVIDLGGNLRAIGTKKNGGSWKTGVQNPDIFADESCVYYFEVADTSVVTSGDYQRYYTVDGKKYHHIINKDTLVPSDYFTSVTIVTKDSGVADALSTALFNMNYEDGLRLVSSIEGTSVVWVKTNGEIITYGFDN